MRTKYFIFATLAVAALATLLYTGGNITALVTMYSINVFLTFSISQFAMLRYWRTRPGDAGRRRGLVLHGGVVLGTTGASFDGVWEHDGQGWLPRPAAGGPGKRGWHAMAYDPRRARVVLFGGADARFKLHADLWAWNGAWSRGKS